jgi:hypothetical protein
MSDKIEKAFELAKRVHAGRVYRTPDGDKDYFDYHVWNVYNRLAHPNSDGDAEIVAVLHDVLEACDPSERSEIGQYISDNFGERVRTALSFISRNDVRYEGYADYQDYIRKLAADKLAAFVKIHDLQENIYHCLTPGASGYAKHRWLPRYVKALNFLTEVINQNQTPRPVLDQAWELVADTCGICGSRLWRREYPSQSYCEKCDRKTSTTSALSYL